MAAGFGLVALPGINERIELEFFGIELNDKVGRLLWVAGSMITIGVALLLLCARKRAP